jgi:SAM-dependent methyltransferase
MVRLPDPCPVFTNDGPTKTLAATYLGITDSSPASLRRFDNWFFAFYPYLFLHVPFAEMRGKDVLEIGLGYGSISQLLAESGCRYRGLDIAPGSVDIVNLRMRQASLDGEAVTGNILNAPFEDNSFDYVVTIGCLHHTGDIERSIAECRRVLRPGGTLVMMLYYAYSYRRFYQARGETVRYFFRELGGYRGVVRGIKEHERAAYDTSANGEAAPHTDFISMKSLRYLCRDFRSITMRLENIEQAPPFRKRTRPELLKTRWAQICGLEIYATAVKRAADVGMLTALQWVRDPERASGNDAFGVEYESVQGEVVTTLRISPGKRYRMRGRDWIVEGDRYRRRVTNAEMNRLYTRKLDIDGKYIIRLKPGAAHPWTKAND